jgi:multicomponent Na+:H+ antiporter subunit F
MTTLYGAIASGLLLSLLLGLIRIWRGPGPADRLMAAQLFGTTGVALLLVLAEWQAQPVLRDVALVLALLAILVVVAFISRVWSAQEPPHD